MTKLPAVVVCGSWNRWEPIPMAYNGGEYTTNLVTVPTGFQQFKFKDNSGQWFCDLALPTILDNGNQNNCIDVKGIVTILLFCSVLFCSVLFCSVMFCSVLFCSVLFCSVLFCSVLFCPVPPYFLVALNLIQNYLTWSSYKQQLCQWDSPPRAS